MNHLQFLDRRLGLSSSVILRLSLIAVFTTLLSSSLVALAASNSSTPVIWSSAPTYLTAGTTTTLTLHGMNFVRGTTLSVSQGTVKTTYDSSNYLKAAITLAAGATGDVSLKATNPSSSASSPLSLDVWYFGFKASDADGSNTGTARLGVPVDFSAKFFAAGFSKVTWTLKGAGKLSYGSSSPTSNVEVYTPPQTMPSDRTVTVSGYMTSYPSLKASYTFSLENPVPQLSSVSPSELKTDGTQSVTIAGSGFEPGTTVLLNGNTLSSTYVNYKQITVKVPVSASAQGNLVLQVENHSPGGGTKNISEPVAVNSVKITATDSDGTNTGTSELQNTVSMTALVSGSLQTAVKWSLEGAGSLSSGGIYTAPNLMPSNNALTITGALVSDPAVSASYHLHLVNPLPVISNTSPESATPGATTTLTITGQGFVPETALSSDLGSITSITYDSPGSLTAKLKLPSSASGNFNLKAENPTPGGGTGPLYEASVATPTSLTAAARVLDQTTFGPTSTLISHVASEGIDAWLEEQFNTPQTVLPYVPIPEPSYCALSSAKCAQSEVWKTMITGDDQLRQRVAFALSEIFVVSIDSEPGYAIPYYSNLLARDAFSNWSTIMKDVALSPAMGVYLNMYDSPKATPGLIANENFARENMQLFNLGEYILNQNGSQQTKGGDPIPTYTEAQVQGFAKAFTGWTYANANGSTPSGFTGTTNYNHPMVAVESLHDETSKQLLDGTVLPAGQTAEEDLHDALTNIFNHPNLPPFVCKQLIQHLVTSDPSPEYISRVAAVFKSDENGIRGNMQSVIRAIVTDPEARAADTDPTADGGHLREPILWTTAVMRGLGFVNTDPHDIYNMLTFETGTLNEAPYESPSVFNFFSPSYVIPQTTIPAPEFGLENSASVMLRTTLADKLVNNQVPTFNVDLSATSPLGKLASNPSRLLTQLNQIFMHSEMDPNMKAAISRNIGSLTDPAQRVRVASYLVVTSPQYLVIH